MYLRITIGMAALCMILLITIGDGLSMLSKIGIIACCVVFWIFLIVWVNAYIEILTHGRNKRS